MDKQSQHTAVLALESGKLFWGYSFGAKAERLGEVVFNTSMTGYQEILTDPSYKGQIVLMTEPHIGNVGINKEDAESAKVYCEGLVVREASPTVSNWRSEESLQEFLISRGIPAMTGIDTRAATRHMRDAGVMRGILSTIDFDPQSLLKKIKDSPQMVGQDLVKEVTCAQPYEWKGAEWKWQNPKNPSTGIPATDPIYRVVMIDFGAKENILRCLAERGCQVMVVPATTEAGDILSMKPDGIMLSNGPGDPAAVTYAIETIKRLIHSQVPMFGICLGHQLLGHALGGKTFKLKFGHRSANHPVKNMKTGQIEITTQNHGFCVDIDSLKNQDVELTHINLNDNTLEGLRHKKLPVFSVQYHPESSAGPHDSRYLFDQFIQLMKARKSEQVEVQA